MILGVLTILAPGLRRDRCMTSRSGPSTMNSVTTVMTAKSLQDSSWSGNTATPELMLKIQRLVQVDAHLRSRILGRPGGTSRHPHWERLTKVIPAQ